MNRQATVLAALGVAAVAGWFLVRPPTGGNEQKGILQEKARAAESAMNTLDAERAAARERLRLAGKNAEEKRARAFRAAAALSPYERRRKDAEALFAAHNKTADETASPFGKGGTRGIFLKIPPPIPLQKGGAGNALERIPVSRTTTGTKGKETADALENAAKNSAALLGRLNAFLR